MKIVDLLDIKDKPIAIYKIVDDLYTPQENEIVVLDFKGWFEYQKGQQLDFGYYHKLRLPDGYCCAGCRADFGRLTKISQSGVTSNEFYGTKGSTIKLDKTDYPIFLYGPVESVKFPGEPKWFIRYYEEDEEGES